MSRKNKNNHYHYAEKFESRSYRSGKREAKAFIPFKAFIFAMLVLLVFGLISTTFATFVEGTEYPAPEGSLIVEVRSVKSSRDVALTGANGDLAATGGSVTFYCAIDPSTVSGKTLRVNYKTGSNNNDGWNSPSFSTTVVGYYQGLAIYSATFTTPYGGAYTYQVQLMNGSNVSATHELWATDWRADSNFNNKIHFWGENTYNYHTYSDYTLGWGGGDYYIYNNVAGCWYGNGSTKPAPKMSVGADSTIRTYDFYLKKDEPGSDGLEFRFWSSTLSKEIAPTVNQTTLPATNLVGYAANGTGDKTWKVATNGFDTGYFYRVHIELDLDANNGSGQVSCTTTKLGLLVPTFSLSNSNPINRGTTITMSNYGGVTNGTTNNVGTITSAYYVKEGSGSYGSAVTSNTFSSTGTFTIKHVVTDSGVNASTSNTATMNAKSARTESVEVTYEVTANVAVSAGTGGTVNKASVAVNQNNSSAQTVEATPSDGYTFSSWSVNSSKNARLSANGSTNWNTSLIGTNPVYVKLNSQITSSNASNAANTNIGITANFSEIMHSVTVDNNVNSDTTTTSNAVGIATTATTTAATVPYCTFSHWTYALDDSTKTFTLRNNTTLNDATITYNATSDVTLTAHYTVDPPTTFTITVYGSSDGDGDYATPYQIPKGASDFKITAEIDNPANGVTYIWSTDGVNWTDGTSNDFDSGFLPTTTQSVSPEQFTIYCKAVINNVQSTSISGSVYYFITAKYLRIDDFNFDSLRDPVQKVYSSSQKSAIDIVAEYYAGATHFTTTLKSSVDNNTFTDTVVGTNTDLVEAFKQFCPNGILPLMDSDGIKFYKIHVEDVENVTNGVQDVTPADSRTIHTTVGTNTSAGSKSIYFQNNTGTDLSTNRLMAFYTVNNTVYYQTAQVFNDTTHTYRFTLPADAGFVSFAAAVSDKYKLPVYTAQDLFNYNSDSDATTFYTARTETYAVNFDSPFYSTINSMGAAGADGLAIIDGSFTAVP